MFWHTKLNVYLGCANKDLDGFLGPLCKFIEYCRIVALLPVIPYTKRNNWQQRYNSTILYEFAQKPQKSIQILICTAQYMYLFFISDLMLLQINLPNQLFGGRGPMRKKSPIFHRQASNHPWIDLWYSWNILLGVTAVVKLCLQSEYIQSNLELRNS